MKIARNLVGSSRVIVIDHIISRGHLQEDCTRLVFRGAEPQKRSAHDINYAGLVTPALSMTTLWRRSRWWRVETYRRRG